MSRLFGISPVVCFVASLATSFIAHAQSYPVSVDSPVAVESEYRADRGQTFEIKNNYGSVEIYETVENKSTVEAVIEKGASTVDVVLEKGPDGENRIIVQPRTIVESYVKDGNVVQKAVSKAPGSVAMNVAGGANVSINISGNKKGPSNVNIQGGGQVNMNIGGQTISYNGEGETRTVIEPVKVKLRIGLPKSLLGDLDVSTREGTIDIEGKFENQFQTKRKVNLSSDAGQIYCVGMCANGKVQVSSLEGDVFLQRVTAEKIKANSITGDIFATQVTGSLNATTDDGEIRIEHHKAGKLKAKSASGEVIVSAPEPGVKIGKISSASGQIDLPEPVKAAQTDRPAFNVFQAASGSAARVRCGQVFR